MKFILYLVTLFAMTFIISCGGSGIDSLTEGRGEHATTLLPNGKLFVSGGRDTKPLTSTELLDLTSGTWTVTAPMINKRYNHGQILMGDGNLLIVGGGSRDLIPEIYNPTSNTWSETEKMQYPRRKGHATTLMSNGRILVTGGIAEVNGNKKPVALVEIYDPTNGTWSLASDMLKPRERHEAILLDNNKVLVVGSNTDDFQVIGETSAELYDPETNQWSPAGNLKNPHGTQFTAVKLADSRVLVAGGGAQGKYIAPNLTNTMDIYDPTTNKWSTVANMTKNSWEHTTNLLNDGTVLFVKASDIETYNPATDSWTTIGVMKESRAGVNTVNLVGGKTYIIGGSSISYDIYGGISKREGLTNVLVYDPSIEW
jgi:N-acetylneuraminic acid mutarotase